MKQLGKVPLLTREQEVEIFQRIEQAENEVKRLVYGLGFTAKEYSAIAEKLLAEPPKERYDRIITDSKVANREQHLKTLRTLVKNVGRLDAQADVLFTRWQAAPAAQRKKLWTQLQQAQRKVQLAFPKFSYRPKVLEEITNVAASVDARFEATLLRIKDLEAPRKSAHRQSAVQAKKSSCKCYERFVRTPQENSQKRWRNCGAFRTCHMSQIPHGGGQPPSGRLHRA